MRKVTITFEYNEVEDGVLESDSFDMIIETLTEYGSNINITDEKQ